MFNVKLDETQKKNLLVFLQRAQLTGNEVPAFMSIVNAINTAEPQKEDGIVQFVGKE